MAMICVCLYGSAFELSHSLFVRRVSVCLYGFTSALSHPLFVGRGACPSRCTEPLHPYNHCKRTIIPRKSPSPLPYVRFVSFAKRSKPSTPLPPLLKVRCCRPKKFGRLPEGLQQQSLAPTNPSKSALSHPHSCKYSVYLYEHGTHFVFPESVLKKALPVGADALVNMSFSAAKKFPAECKAMRLDLDKKLTEEILNWKSNN